MSDQATETFEGWAILELMGHRRLGGRVMIQEIAGAAFIRIDVPATPEAEASTQFYNPTALYGLTPTTEAIARSVAEERAPAPVSRYDLPAEWQRAIREFEAGKREKELAIDAGGEDVPF